MSRTWQEHFLSTHDAPVVKRTRSGIFIPDGSEVVGYFTGHPQNVWENGEWKPITLEISDGKVHGSDFGWKNGVITHKGHPLHGTTGVMLNGSHIPLGDPLVDGNIIKREAGPFVYQVRFTERGVKEELVINDPVYGHVGFEYISAKLPRGIRRNQMHAWDASGKSLVCDDRIAFIPEDAVFPVVIDPDYTGSTGDKYIYGYSTSYATARSTSYGSDASLSYIVVGQRIQGFVNMQISRGYLGFDTSGLPDANLTAATLTLTAKADNSATNFDVQIVKHDWSGDTQEEAYDNCLSGTADTSIWRNTSGMSLNTNYTSGSLDTSRVSKSGSTYYSLRSSRDYSNTEPTGDEDIQIYSADETTPGYRPYLTVTYTQASLVAVII